jgi:hypothetical protein
MFTSGGVQQLLDGLHIEVVEVKMNTYKGDGNVVKQVSNPGSLRVLCGLFAALGALHSYGWSFNVVVNPDLPNWIAPFAGCILLVISAIFAWVAQSPDRASFFWELLSHWARFRKYQSCIF